MASVSRAYAQDQLIALRRQSAEADAAAPIAASVDINTLNLRCRIERDNPPWRPVRVFDDGRLAFIEFPRGIADGEKPPCVSLISVSRRGKIPVLCGPLLGRMKPGGLYQGKMLSMRGAQFDSSPRSPWHLRSRVSRRRSGRTHLARRWREGPVSARPSRNQVMA